MESGRDCTWILGLPGFRVTTIEGEDDNVESRLRVHLERRGQRYPCSGCGRRTARVRSKKDRTWDDLTWAAHPVTLVYQQRRVCCRRCGIRRERIEFADAKARVTRRLRRQIFSYELLRSRADLERRVGLPCAGRHREQETLLPLAMASVAALTAVAG